MKDRIIEAAILLALLAGLLFAGIFASTVKYGCDQLDTMEDVEPK